MTGEPSPEPGGSRSRLARAQTELLAALVAGAPPPPGFDPVRLLVQADALVAKRREVVAKLRPDLVEAAGSQFRDRFDGYARTHSRPAAGARADADAFARTMPPRRPIAEPGSRRACSGWLIDRMYQRREPEPQPSCSPDEGGSELSVVQIAILGRLVRPGMQFQHRRWVIGLPDGSVRADTCTITAVRHGVVHYRGESGQVAKSNPSHFVTEIDRWLDEAA